MKVQVVSSAGRNFEKAKVITRFSFRAVAFVFRKNNDYG